MKPQIFVLVCYLLFFDLKNKILDIEYLAKETQSSVAHELAYGLFWKKDFVESLAYFGISIKKIRNFFPNYQVPFSG